MPEPLDFDRIARQIVFNVQMAIEGAGRHPEPIIAEQLRQVWNARGAADIAKVELLDEAPADMTTSAIRSLDR